MISRFSPGLSLFSKFSDCCFQLVIIFESLPSSFSFSLMGKKGLVFGRQMVQAEFLAGAGAVVWGDELDSALICFCISFLSVKQT